MNDVSVDDIAKELNSVTVELTILELEVQMVFPKFLEDLHHMVVMFGLVLGIDVIIIDDDKMIEEFLEHLVRESLEDGG